MDNQPIPAIRDAFASGEFARAHRLWDAYAAGLRAAILQGSARPAMLADARQLIDWARLVVEGFRAHAGDRLRSARVAQVYAGPGALPPNSVRARF